MKLAPWVAAIMVAWAGCAELPLAPPLTSPKHGGAAWSHVRSRHFIVDSDLGPARTRELAVELDGIETAFEDLTADREYESTERIEVVSFARRQDYLEIAKQHQQPSSSAFFAYQTHDFEPRPTLVISGDLNEETRTVLQHELTHRFVRQQMRDVPTWLSEGLADYNSMLALRDGKAWLGAMPPHWMPLVRPGGSIAIGRDARQRRLTIDDLPTVQWLLEATPATFYFRIEDHPNPEQPLAYAGAWLLVHMLKAPNLPFSGRFDRLIALLSGGMHRDAAFAQAFAGVPMAELERQYRGHAAELSAPVLPDGERWTTFSSGAYTPRAVAPVDDATSLSDAQVHLVFLRLRAWQPPYRDATNGELVSAQIDAPADPEVLYWRALFALSGGASANAEPLLRQALQTSPREPRYRLALCEARVQTLLHSGAKHEPELFAPLEDDFQQLASVAKSATALNGVARYHWLRANAKAGMPFAIRAVQADPTCAQCFDTMALLYAQRGLFVQAVEAEERASTLMPAWAQLPDVAPRLAEFRRRAAAPPAETDAPATPPAAPTTTTTPPPPTTTTPPPAPTMP